MATKYRITLDGNGCYWPQYKIWMWWCDLSLGPLETIDMANSRIETDRSFDRRKERMPVEGPIRHIEPTKPWPKV